MKRILILENSRRFARELAACLEGRGDVAVCGTADDDAESMNLLRKFLPSTVILSLRCKGADGFSVMETARAQGMKCDFLVLGDTSDEQILSRAVSLGARYYFMKPVPAALVAARAASL